jgi:predicted RNA-binding protein with RPS1 domain
MCHISAITGQRVENIQQQYARGQPVQVLFVIHFSER